MKYKTINGKIRHAHAPVGPKIDYSEKEMRYFARRPPGGLFQFQVDGDVQHCIGCGYHVCSCPSPEEVLEWAILACESLYEYKIDAVKHLVPPARRLDILKEPK